MTENQNPEQRARDKIDALLKQAGWVVQSARKIDLNAGLGQAVREYQTDVGPADYVLFVDQKAVGVIEAKREEEGQHITTHETQTEGYATAKLKWINNQAPLPFSSTRAPVSLLALQMAAIRSPGRARCSAFIAHRPSKNGCRKVRACSSACSTYPN